MTSIAEYLTKIERELRETRKISDQSCLDFLYLPDHAQLAFVRSLQFLGCESLVIDDASPSELIEDEDRVRAARLMLLKLSVDTDDPRWSSWILEQMLKVAIVDSGGSVGNVIEALFDLLEEYEAALTRTMVFFLRDITVKLFTSYRDSYNLYDFAPIALRVRKRATEATAYLALLVLPGHDLATCQHAILRALSTSPFRDEAIRMLEDGNHT